MSSYLAENARVVNRSSVGLSASVISVERLIWVLERIGSTDLQIWTDRSMQYCDIAALDGVPFELVTTVTPISLIGYRLPCRCFCRCICLSQPWCSRPCGEEVAFRWMRMREVACVCVAAPSMPVHTLMPSSIPKKFARRFHVVCRGWWEAIHAVSSRAVKHLQGRGSWTRTPNKHTDIETNRRSIPQSLYTQRSRSGYILRRSPTSFC